MIQQDMKFFPIEERRYQR